MKREMSEEAQKILDFLLTTKVHQQIPHDLMRNLTGVNDLPRLRGFFRTASERVLNSHSMRFKAVRGVGWERLDENGKEAEITDGWRYDRRRIRRKEKLHNAVEFHALNAINKLAHVVNATQLTDLKRAASKASRTEITKIAGKSDSAQEAVKSTWTVFNNKGRKASQ